MHEEVTETGGFLRETGFKREDRVLEVRRWMDLAETSEIEGHFFDILKSRLVTSSLLFYEQFQRVLERELNWMAQLKET